MREFGYPKVTCMLKNKKMILSEMPVNKGVYCIFGERLVGFSEQLAAFSVRLVNCTEITRFTLKHTKENFYTN